MKVREIIRKYGHTLDTVAEKMGTSTSNISQIAKGNPTVQKLREIAAVLGCPVWEFFIDEMDMEDVKRLMGLAQSAQDTAQEQASEAVAELPFGADSDKRPDLIVIDRESGKTFNYVLQEKP